jgi:hypothetical protein
MMVFIVGALLGLVLGCAACVRYLRREIAADVGPALKRVELQLETIETQLNLAIMTRYADFASSAHAGTSRHLPGRVDD